MKKEAQKQAESLATGLCTDQVVDLVLEDDFRNQVFGDRARQHLRQLKVNFERAGMRPDSTVVDAFNILSSTAFARQTQLVNDSLYFHHNTGSPPQVDEDELHVWFAQTICYSLMNFSKGKIDGYLEKDIRDCGGEYRPDKLISRDRHREIMRHIGSVPPQVFAASASGTCRDRTNRTKHVHDWARNVLRRSVEIFMTSFSVLTMDDWLSGLRALDIDIKHKADRKAATWGVVADMVCDMFFRFVVDVRHKERGYDAKKSMENTLREVFQRWTADMSELVFCADRGYVKGFFWRLLAEYEVGFTLVCDSTFSTTAVVLSIGASHSSSANFPPQYRVPDGVTLGPAIFHACSDVPLADGCVCIRSAYPKNYQHENKSRW